MLNTVDLTKPPVHLETTSVICSINVKLASKVIPRLFADFDGVIVFPNKVMLKS